MGVRAHKPTSPGRRGAIASDFSEITKSSPEKSLLAPLTKKGGRNNRGRITVRHRGGGHKRRYRIIDFARAASKSDATVLAIEYDPNRTARIALVRYEDGTKKYVIAPERLGVGDKIRNGEDAPVTPRQCHEGGPATARDVRSQHRTCSRQWRATGSQRRGRGSNHGSRRRLHAGETAQR